MKKFLIPAIGVLALAGGIAIAAPQGGPGKADANGDGSVSRAEMTAQVDARFARMDANGDGRVTAEDRAQLRTKRQDARFARLDSDSNGAISRTEWDATQTRMTEARKDRHEKRGERAGKMGRKGPRMAMMSRIDANGDGILTKEEMSASAVARFDRVDANKDGVITAAEREQARAAMKERRRG